MLVAKYGNHLPLYRQEKIFARDGVEIARSTLADWVGRCGVALQTLVDALRDPLHQQAVLHADDKFIRNEFEQLQLAAWRRSPRTG